MHSMPPLGGGGGRVARQNIAMKFGTDKPEWLGDPIDAEEILKICLFILTKFTNVTEFMNVTEEHQMTAYRQAVLYA